MYVHAHPKITWSLPSRERGLKFRFASIPGNLFCVAPLAGAWIEILILVRKSIIEVVAPLAGAWIEIALADTVGAKSLSRSPRGSVD